MTYRLETLNCGGIDECGFVFGDTELVRLGALPAMPLEQFAEYSTDTLLKILEAETIPPEIRDSIRTRIAYICGRISQARISSLNSGKSDKSMTDFIETVTPQFASQVGTPGRRYDRNPFVLDEASITISKLYTVDIPEFAIFSTHILGGGVMGWTLGVPKDILKQHKRLLEVSVPGFPTQ